MPLDPLAGKPAPSSLLIHVSCLVSNYFINCQPDPSNANQQVAFGTSGHRGTATNGSFNEAHILATTQAICDYRQDQGIGGPLFLGKDTHALFKTVFITALRVLAANEAEPLIDEELCFTPTPVISYAILTHNREAAATRAGGIVITPFHNPPTDDGYKYNPPSGGPADTEITSWIEARANHYLAEALKGVQRIAYEWACSAFSKAGFKIVADPMGGGRQWSIGAHC